MELRNYFLKVKNYSHWISTSEDKNVSLVREKVIFILEQRHGKPRVNFMWALKFIADNIYCRVCNIYHQRYKFSASKIPEIIVEAISNINGISCSDINRITTLTSLILKALRHRSLN